MVVWYISILNIALGQTYVSMGCTCDGRLKLLAGLRFLLFPVLLLDALPAEFLLLRLFAAGLAGSAVNQNIKAA